MLQQLTHEDIQRYILSKLNPESKDQPEAVAIIESNKPGVENAHFFAEANCEVIESFGKWFLPERSHATRSDPQKAMLIGGGAGLGIGVAHGVYQASSGLCQWGMFGCAAQGGLFLGVPLGFFGAILAGGLSFMGNQEHLAAARGDLRKLMCLTPEGIRHWAVLRQKASFVWQESQSAPDNSGPVVNPPSELSNRFGRSSST